MSPAVGTALLACFAALLVEMRADDWPQWRGPNRDGVCHETGLLQTFPTNGLPVSWRVPVGRGWSSPVVAQGRVFITDVHLVASNATERVLCVDEATGKPLWVHEYKAAYPAWAFDPNAGGPRATPAVRDGRLFTLGAMGQFFCLDASTGRVVWKKDLAQEYEVKEFSGITASPLIEDDLVILYMCGKPNACVVAFHRNSGREIWRALDDSFTYTSLISFTAAGQRQLIVWTQEAITSLDPKTGRTWWRELLRTPGDAAVATPVFSNPWLLLGGLMMKLDPDQPAASILWPEARAISKRILSNTSTPLLQGPHVFSAMTSGELICLEARTGHELWRTNSVTDLKNGSSIHITVNGDSVLLFTNEGNLIRARLDATGYHELSRVHVLDPTHPFNGRNVLWPPPAFANRHIFARNDRELIRASLSP